MALFKLCPDDQLVNTLHTVFHANIVRIPEARCKPLAVIAVTSGEPHFWGYLEELTEFSIPNVQSSIKEGAMANISGKHSKSVSIDLGLQILEGFLSGFNLPSAAITTKFTGAKTVSFSFQQVVRQFISPGQLGKLMQGHALDAGNGSNDIFFNKEAKLLVVDSVITSKDFSITVDSTNETNFSLDVPAIQEIIGQAKTNVQVASSTGLDITFQGNTPLAFAFTCLSCKLDEAGRIALTPTSSTINFEVNQNQSVEHELLYNELGMIDFSN
jgi:hypothetical protein